MSPVRSNSRTSAFARTSPNTSVARNWTTPTSYPILSKYTDPNNGYNNMYMIRLADILLLRAEAYNAKSDLANAALMVNRVRTRAHLGAITAASQ